MKRLSVCERFSRRGYSLIEMMVVITLSGVVTGGAAFCIHTMLKGERLTAEAIQEAQGVSRLRSQWQGDAHLARDWKAEVASDQAAKGMACEFLKSDGQKVHYRSSTEGLLREVFENEMSVERELYRFPRETRFECSRSDAPPIVSLKIYRPVLNANSFAGVKGGSSGNVWGTSAIHFEGALGRHVRLVDQLIAKKPNAKEEGAP